MTTVSYVSDLASKISLRPSRQAIKRAALALALTLGVAGAADFGYGYLTTGRYLESTDDAYVKADSTIIAPKVSGYIAEVLVAITAGRRRCWPTMIAIEPRWLRPARMSMLRKSRGKPDAQIAVQLESSSRKAPKRRR
jgi:hypothetical protein